MAKKIVTPKILFLCQLNFIEIANLATLSFGDITGFMTVMSVCDVVRVFVVWKNKIIFYMLNMVCFTILYCQDKILITGSSVRDV